MANREGLATGDFNLGQVLREQVIPEFLLDVDSEVGKVYWRRTPASLNLVASDSVRDYDLPAAFDRFDGEPIMVTAQNARYELTHIGEDSRQVALANNSTTQTRPTGYFLVPGSTAGLWAVRFNAFPDAAYTVPYVYFIKIPFTDYTTKVDLSTYIPDQFHIAIVHGLRAAIMEDRYGIEDKRAKTERGLYQRVISNMGHHQEAAPRRHAVFVN
jgi:hypothetical protein